MILHFIKDHGGEIHAYTEQELHDKIMEDEKLGYYDTSSPIGMFPMPSWCAPLVEIGKVVSKISTKNFREDICRMVLTRCTYFLDAGYNFGALQREAIWECFTELPPDTELNCEIRANYISSYIDYIIRDENYFKAHSGGSWRRFCQDFRRGANYGWEELYRVEEISNWAKELHEDFKNRVEQAESENLFEKEESNGLKTFVCSVVNSL